MYFCTRLLKTFQTLSFGEASKASPKAPYLPNAFQCVPVKHILETWPACCLCGQGTSSLPKWSECGISGTKPAWTVPAPRAQPLQTPAVTHRAAVSCVREKGQLLGAFIKNKEWKQEREEKVPSFMNGPLWWAAVPSVNVFNSIWSRSKTANWWSVLRRSARGSVSPRTHTAPSVDGPETKGSLLLDRDAQK